MEMIKGLLSIVFVVVLTCAEVHAVSAITEPSSTSNEKVNTEKHPLGENFNTSEPDTRNPYGKNDSNLTETGSVESYPEVADTAKTPRDETQSSDNNNNSGSDIGKAVHDDGDSSGSNKTVPATTPRRQLDQRDDGANYLKDILKLSRAVERHIHNSVDRQCTAVRKGGSSSAESYCDRESETINRPRTWPLNATVPSMVLFRLSVVATRKMHSNLVQLRDTVINRLLINEGCRSADDSCTQKTGKIKHLVNMVNRLNNTLRESSNLVLNMRSHLEQSLKTIVQDKRQTNQKASCRQVQRLRRQLKSPLPCHLLAVKTRQLTSMKFDLYCLGILHHAGKQIEAINLALRLYGGN